MIYRDYYMNKNVDIELWDGVIDFYGVQHLLFSVGFWFHTIEESWQIVVNDISLEQVNMQFQGISVNWVDRRRSF